MDCSPNFLGKEGRRIERTKWREIEVVGCMEGEAGGRYYVKRCSDLRRKLEILLRRSHSLIWRRCWQLQPLSSGGEEAAEVHNTVRVNLDGSVWVFCCAL